MPQHDDAHEPVSSTRSAAWPSFDIDPDIHVPSRAQRATDGGRARAFSWRNWFAHGA